MKEEDELLRKCGTKNPFTVPEDRDFRQKRGNCDYEIYRRHGFFCPLSIRD